MTVQTVTLGLDGYVVHFRAAKHGIECDVLKDGIPIDYLGYPRLKQGEVLADMAIKYLEESVTIAKQKEAKRGTS